MNFFTKFNIEIKTINCMSKTTPKWTKYVENIKFAYILRLKKKTSISQ